MRMCKMFLISYSGFVHIVEKYIKELYGVQWLLQYPQDKCISHEDFLKQTYILAQVWVIINLFRASSNSFFRVLFLSRFYMKIFDMRILYYITYTEEESWA